MRLFYLLLLMKKKMKFFMQIKNKIVNYWTVAFSHNILGKIAFESKQHKLE